MATSLATLKSDSRTQTVLIQVAEAQLPEYLSPDTLERWKEELASRGKDLGDDKARWWLRVAYSHKEQRFKIVPALYFYKKPKKKKARRKKEPTPPWLAILIRDAKPEPEIPEYCPLCGGKYKDPLWMVHRCKRKGAPNLALSSTAKQYAEEYCQKYLDTEPMKEALDFERANNTHKQFIRQRRAVPRYLQDDDFYQEAWVAWLSKGIDVNKYLGACLDAENRWRQPSLCLLEDLYRDTGITTDETRPEARGAMALQTESRTRDDFLNEWIRGNQLLRKPKSRTAREKAFAEILGYDWQAWKKYYQKNKKYPHHPPISRAAYYVQPTSETERSYQRARDMLWDIDCQAQHKKNPMPKEQLLWKEGLYGAYQAPAPIQVVIAKLDRHCPWCNRSRRPEFCLYLPDKEELRKVNQLKNSRECCGGKCICGFSF